MFVLIFAQAFLLFLFTLFHVLVHVLASLFWVIILHLIYLIFKLLHILFLNHCVTELTSSWRFSRQIFENPQLSELTQSPQWGVSSATYKLKQEAHHSLRQGETLL